jgi:hypothetical protein
MTGDLVKVSAVPGGYLISTRTGRRHAAADLGAVWDQIATINPSIRTQPEIPRLPGVMTTPPPRPALTQVVLVVDNEENGDFRPESPNTVDCRMLDSSLLWEQVRGIVDRRRPAELQVIVRAGAIEHRPTELRAHPARPFAVTEIKKSETMQLRLPQAEPPEDFIGKIPALLAWLAAIDGAVNKSELRIQVRLGESRSLAINVVRGIVTRCEMLRGEVTTGVLDQAVVPRHWSRPVHLAGRLQA